MSEESLFIVWAEHSRRAETLAAELHAQPCFLYELRLKGRPLTPLRYLVQGWETWRLLERERPEVVLVQAPPIFAPLIVAAWCVLRGKKSPSRLRAPYVVDCHTGTFHDARWRWTLSLLRVLSKRAAATLVTNEAARGLLLRWGVKCIYLLDGLPTLTAAAGTIGSEGEARVAVISTFADSEPIAEVFAAARLLPRVTLYVTGDPKRAPAKLLAHKPANVTLTGFLRGGTYAALLKNVHGIVILTNEPNDLSCAAYEALAVAKPAVVSDCSENKRWFTRGFVYVHNTPEAIAAGISAMLRERAVLVPEVIAMRSELAASRRPRLEELAALIK
jgi:glycosyltransferase involved in cell wall biosynthesis